MSSYRIELETTPEGRIAAVARAEIYRHFKMVNRPYPPDFEDFRSALEIPVKAEILNAKLEEARLKPDNNARVMELTVQLRELIFLSIR
jgi:hypothetical protein